MTHAPARTALTHAESYRGCAVHVWTVGGLLVGWGYTIDLVERVDSADPVGKRPHAALIDGLIAARLNIDQRLGPQPTVNRLETVQAANLPCRFGRVDFEDRVGRRQSIGSGLSTPWTVDLIA